MKIIFLGTPDFAKNVLQKLINSKHQVVAVVCQPDRLVGRKQILTSPPTKILAQENNIPVYQFDKIKKEGIEPLKKLNADIMITSAYGQILNQELLDLTPYGVINVHGSLLPKYRGSSPVQWALINGEKVTGATIMKTDIGMDTGDMIEKVYVDIEDNDTVSSLLKKISDKGGDLLLKVLDDLENGKAKFTKQNQSESSYYPMLDKEMAKIDFNKTNDQICNFIRGLEEWPTAYCYLDDEILKIYKSISIEFDDVDKNHKLGEIVECSPKKGIIVCVNDGYINLITLKLGSGKLMDGKSFANGHKNLKGKVLK